MDWLDCLENDMRGTDSVRETSRWLESGPVQVNVVDGPSRGTTLEELTKWCTTSRLHKSGGCHDMTRLEPMTLCYRGQALDH